VTGHPLKGRKELLSGRETTATTVISERQVPAHTWCTQVGPKLKVAHGDFSPAEA
jgi:hypothetical protein